MTSHMIDDVMASRFILLASITAVITGIATTVSFLGIYSALNFMDTAILLGLAFGVYIKKSRTCAIILLVCHLGIRFDMYQRTHSLYAAFGLVPIAIAWVYFLAILGTFAFYAHKKEPSSTLASE